MARLNDTPMMPRPDVFGHLSDTLRGGSPTTVVPRGPLGPVAGPAAAGRPAARPIVERRRLTPLTPRRGTGVAAPAPVRRSPVFPYPGER